MEEANRVIFIHVPHSNSRSVSPMSPSPCREKNLGFFHALSRRFCRRSTEDLSLHGEDDSRSSSTDSCSSTSAGDSRISKKNITTTESTLEISCSVSETDSNDSTVTRKSNIETTRTSRRSSSIRRALQGLSLSSRSLSCSGTPIRDNSTTKQKKSKKPPQRILRQPVTYTYLKGISGLPTQRVPRSSLCCNSHR